MLMDDKFVNRQPILSKKEIFKLYGTDDYQKFLDEKFTNKALREALLVGTKTYFDFYTEKKSNINEKAYITLSKYYLRMASRPSPYGLFAGVNYRSFSEDNLLIPDNKKTIKISQEWLRNVIKKVENNQTIGSSLMLYTNRILVEKGEICVLDKGNKKLLLNLNPSIRILLKEFRDGNTIKNVVDKYDTNIKKDLLDVIKTLLQQEFLCSELSLSNIENNFSFSSIIKFSKNTSFYWRLIKINNLISHYERIKIGEGIVNFQKIIKEMEGIVRSDRYLDINLKILSNNSNCLPFDKDETEREFPIFEDIFFCTYI